MTVRKVRKGPNSDQLTPPPLGGGAVAAVRNRTSKPEFTAEEVRTALATDPALLALADQLKTRFSARLVYLRVGEREIGSRKSFQQIGPEG